LELQIKSVIITAQQPAPLPTEPFPDNRADQA